MIGAFTLLRETRDDVRLVIVGDGPLRPLVERMVPAAMRDDVLFAGRVNRLRPRYLAGAEILCTPCSLASFGMVLLEGMSAGLPVVASRLPGLLAGHARRRRRAHGRPRRRRGRVRARARRAARRSARAPRRWARRAGERALDTSPGRSWSTSSRSCTATCSRAGRRRARSPRLREPEVQDVGRLRGARRAGSPSASPPARRRRAGAGDRRALAGAWLLRHVRTRAPGCSARPRRRPRRAGRFALTFDDGPDPRHTLAISRAARASAAIARRSSSSAAPCAQHTRPAAAVARPGTSSRRHGDDHRLLALTSPHGSTRSSPPPRTAVRDATGEPPAPLFRAPHGVRSPWLAARRARGAATASAPGTAASSTRRCPAPTTIVERVRPLLRPGAVILLHDGDGSGARCVAGPDGRGAAGDPRRGGAARAALRAAERVARTSTVQTRIVQERFAPITPRCRTPGGCSTRSRRSPSTSGSSRCSARRSARPRRTT